jgi:threonine/homoserine/homoserine lactone efflux protein
MLLDPARLALFVGAALLLLVTPGPAVLYITARSMSQGVRAGLVSVLAVETGNLVQAVAAALGLAALLASSALAFSVVKLLGAGYLVYLGIRKLTSTPDGAVAGAGAPARRLRAVYLDGVIVAVLNPKTALFFLAFLPQFVDRAAGPPVPQILLLGLLFNIQGTLVNLAVALAASRGTNWLRANERSVCALRRLTGALFLALGARLAVAGNK